MPSKQLIDLVHRLRSSGIKISFTTPRTKTMIHLQEAEERKKSMTGSGLYCKKEGNHPVIDLLQSKSVRDAAIPH